MVLTTSVLIGYINLLSVVIAQAAPAPHRGGFDWSMVIMLFCIFGPPFLLILGVILWAMGKNRSKEGSPKYHKKGNDEKIKNTNK